MLLSVPLLSRASFLDSLINKCRQVIRIKPVNRLETNSKPNISTSITTTPIPTATITCSTLPASSLTSVQHTIRPASVAKLSLSSRSNVPKTLEEKAGLPPRPKRPLTPYFRYMNELRPKLHVANPQLSLIEIVKKISKQWQNVDASVKQRLLDEYKKDQQEYIETRMKYDCKISDEQRSQLNDLKQERSNAKEKRMMRKRIKELGRPKKPASSFLLFVAKERTATPQTSKETYREWHKKITAKWGTMSDEQKSVFTNEARKGYEIYKKEVSLWEEKMIRLGHIDVIRHSNLIELPEPKQKKN